MSFKKLDQEDISISADSIVAPAWSTGTVEMTLFYTSSTQTNGSSGDFYYKVFDKNINTDTTATTQFSIAFGNKQGSGSEAYNVTAVGKSPSSTIYGQYRSLVFGDEGTDFTFGTKAQDSFYAITVDRSRYKEKLLPGTFNLTLSGSGDSKIFLTDNSLNTTVVTYADAGRVYEIVSGSNGAAYSGTGYTTDSGSYGKFLPDVGVILLNAKALDITTVQGISLGTDLTSNADGLNPRKLYNAISLGKSFKLQSEETISSNYIFVRVRNSEYNYSTNPSNITGSGELLHNIMVNSPQAYITTVGLYNNNNDLLGVAKLSKPLLKDFTKEALVRIKLDY